MKKYYELKIKELELQEELRKIQEELKKLQPAEGSSSNNQVAAEPEAAAAKQSFKNILLEQEKQKQTLKEISLRPEEPKPKEKWYVVLTGPKAGVFPEKEKELIKDQPKEIVKEAQTKLEAQTIMKIQQIQGADLKKKFVMPVIRKDLPNGPLTTGHEQFSFEEWKRYYPQITFCPLYSKKWAN